MEGVTASVCRQEGGGACRGRVMVAHRGQKVRPELFDAHAAWGAGGNEHQVARWLSAREKLYWQAEGEAAAESHSEGALAAKLPLAREGCWIVLEGHSDVRGGSVLIVLRTDDMLLPCSCSDCSADGGHEGWLVCSLLVGLASREVYTHISAGDGHLFALCRVARRKPGQCCLGAAGPLGLHCR